MQRCFIFGHNGVIIFKKIRFSAALKGKAQTALPFYFLANLISHQQLSLLFPGLLQPSCFPYSATLLYQPH